MTAPNRPKSSSRFSGSLISNLIFEMDLKPGNRTYPEKLLDGGLPIVRPAEVVDHLEGVIQSKK